MEKTLGHEKWVAQNVSCSVGHTDLSSASMHAAADSAPMTDDICHPMIFV